MLDLARSHPMLPRPRPQHVDHYPQYPPPHLFFVTTSHKLPNARRPFRPPSHPSLLKLHYPLSATTPISMRLRYPVTIPIRQVPPNLPPHAPRSPQADTSRRFGSRFPLCLVTYPALPCRKGNDVCGDPDERQGSALVFSVSKGARDEATCRSDKLLLSTYA